MSKCQKSRQNDTAIKHCPTSLCHIHRHKAACRGGQVLADFCRSINRQKSSSKEPMLKECGIYANITIKERLNFPVPTLYHIDSITRANCLAGKFNAV
jgi:hypothetical protein